MSKENNNIIIEDEIKEVFDNIEENKEQSKRKAPGFNISKLQSKDDEMIEVTEETRTLAAPQAIVDEIIKDIFEPLDITEENGLLENIPRSDGTCILKWETNNLSTIEDEELEIQDTIYKASLIECLLYRRKLTKLLVGVKDYDEKPFPVLPQEDPLIASMFEIVVNSNKKEAEKAWSLFQDTLKWTTEECNRRIHISKRPAHISNMNMLKDSYMVIGLAEDQIADLQTAYNIAYFGKKANKIINKGSVTLYNGAKMVGDSILKPGAEVLGMTTGSLAGSMAQSIGVGLSEGANEFCKAFNLKAIKERPSTIELKNRIFKNKRSFTGGGEL